MMRIIATLGFTVLAAIGTGYALSDVYLTATDTIAATYRAP